MSFRRLFMIDRKNRLCTMADILVFAFPVLILCVPRGAGVFLAGVGLLMLAGWRQMLPAWREHAPVLRPLALSVLAFVAVFLVSKFLHDTPWDVLDNPSRVILSVLTCWLIVRTAPNPAMLWRGITIALVLALLIVAYQKFALGQLRPAAWTQAIAFANMVAAIGLAGFARPGESRLTHATAWFNVLCATAILMLNGTRGAVVAMLLTVVPMLIIRYRRFTTRMFAIAIATVVVLAVGVYSIPGSPVSQRVDQAVAEIQQFEQGNIETSVGVRLKIWHIGMQYFSEHPWTGAGVGQFARILHATPFCKQTKSLACVLEHAHSDLVEAAATTGLPGLLTMLGLFLVPAGLFFRAMLACNAAHNDRGVSLAGAGLGVVMASLISGMTQVTMAHQANVVFYAGFIGLLLGLAAHEAFESKNAVNTLKSAQRISSVLSDQSETRTKVAPV